MSLEEMEMVLYSFKKMQKNMPTDLKHTAGHANFSICGISEARVIKCRKGGGPPPQNADLSGQESFQWVLLVSFAPPRFGPKNMANAAGEA